MAFAKLVLKPMILTSIGITSLSISWANRLARALGVGADVAQDIVNTIRQADEETQSFFNSLG
jgi:hypothetical protein